MQRVLQALLGVWTGKVWMWCVGGGHAYGVEVSSRGSGQDPGRAYGKDSSWAGMSRLAAASQRLSVWAVRREGERGRGGVSRRGRDRDGGSWMRLAAAQQRLQSGGPYGDGIAVGIAHMLAQRGLGICEDGGAPWTVPPWPGDQCLSRWRHEPMPATRAPMQGCQSVH